MHRNIIRQYYILSGLFSAGGMQVISAIYVTYLIHNGLNLFQVNLVNASYFLTLFICEIPTGAFADIFGRKTSFVAACGLMCLSMFVYGCSHSFAGFIAAEMIGAIGSTFRSGAFQAWLVDSLKHHGYTGEFRPIFAREGLYNQIGGGIGAVCGSYLAACEPTLPWFVGGTFMAFTTIAAFIIMKEDYFVREAFSFKKGALAMKNVARSSFAYAAKDSAVRFVLLITAVQIFSVQALNMYWQPYFTTRGVSERHLGWLFIAMMAALACGSFIISKKHGKGSEKDMLKYAQIWAGALAMCATAVPGLPLMMIAFVLHEVPRGCFGPLISSYLHHRIPSKERATVASFCAIAPHIGGAIGLLISGAIAQCFGITVAWITAGTSLIIGAVLVARNDRKNTLDEK